MTDRHAAYIVVLDKDIRNDDAQATIQALSQIRGVAAVKAVTSTPEIMVAAVRERARLQELLWKALHDDVGSERGRST